MILKKGTRLILYTSYCDEGGCTSSFPCDDCLRISNVFELLEDVTAVNKGELDFIQAKQQEKIT